jgi:hypothetical protein
VSINSYACSQYPPYREIRQRPWSSSPARTSTRGKQGSPALNTSLELVICARRDRQVQLDFLSLFSSATDVKLDNNHVCHALPAAEPATHGAMTTANCTLSSCSPRRLPSAPVAQQIAWNEPSSALCHSGRTRPARRRRDSTVQNRVRRRSTASRMSSHSWVLIALFSILLCCQHVDAGKLHGSRRLTRRDDLLVDKRVAPKAHPRLKSREEHKQSHKHVEKQQSNDAALLTDSSVPEASLPHPFDTNLGNNFTAPSCPTFFHNFLNSNDFNDCLPFSLLLQVRSFNASVVEYQTANTR